jgi:hypothetical protein
MAEFLDISTWNKQEWQNTGGTRNKKYVQSFDGENYYFKTSLQKEGKDYKYEFWSEIIAYEIGISLGFNVLRYDIAVNEGKVGCLSKDMINQNKEVLNEGIRYLVAFDNTFNPKFKKLRNRYDFQLIKNSLEYLGYGDFIKNIIETIIFDSIIGNGDRHQENWAIISENIQSSSSSNIVTPKLQIRRNGWFERAKIWYNKNNNEDAEIFLKDDQETFDLLWQGKTSFAPIYDSGSSLARECSDEKIKNMLKNPDELDAFIRRGKSEIHWHNQELRHFELLRKINESYPKVIKEVLLRVQQRFDKTKIEGIVMSIDNSVPPEYSENKIPVFRKELIVKLITLRTISLLGEFL